MNSDVKMAFVRQNSRLHSLRFLSISCYICRLSIAKHLWTGNIIDVLENTDLSLPSCALSFTSLAVSTKRSESCLGGETTSHSLVENAFCIRFILIESRLNVISTHSATQQNYQKWIFMSVFAFMSTMPWPLPDWVRATPHQREQTSDILAVVCFGSGWEYLDSEELGIVVLVFLRGFCFIGSYFVWLFVFLVSQLSSGMEKYQAPRSLLWKTSNYISLRLTVYILGDSVCLLSRWI